MEPFVYVTMQDSASRTQGVEIVPFGDAADVAAVRRKWAAFDARRCECFDPADKERIMAIIASSTSGVEGFNREVLELFAREFP